MKVRVKQGHSVEFGGIWFNQGDVITAPEGAKFEAGQVEVIEAAPVAESKKTKKEEG